MKTSHYVLWAGLPLILLQACAYHRPDEVTAQMARTEAVIQQAERSGAQEAALAEYQGARDKYADAKQALDKKSKSGDEAAVRLAKQAEVDAQYASAKAQAARQQAAAREVQQGTQQLGQEAQRNAAAPAPTPAP
ncbi:MAG: DUF4398 domain-containing protein [Steroidobacteraceae bacterium]